MSVRIFAEFLKRPERKRGDCVRSEIEVGEWAFRILVIEAGFNWHARLGLSSNLRCATDVARGVGLSRVTMSFHFVKEGSILSPDSRSSEQFIHGIKVLMARNYSQNLGEETLKGMVPSQPESSEGLKRSQFWLARQPKPSSASPETFFPSIKEKGEENGTNAPPSMSLGEAWLSTFATVVERLVGREGAQKGTPRTGLGTVRNSLATARNTDRTGSPLSEIIPWGSWTMIPIKCLIGTT